MCDSGVGFEFGARTPDLQGCRIRSWRSSPFLHRCRTRSWRSNPILHRCRCCGAIAFYILHLFDGFAACLGARAPTDFAAVRRPWRRPGGETLRANVTPAGTAHVDISTTDRYRRRGEQAKCRAGSEPRPSLSRLTSPCRGWTASRISSLTVSADVVDSAMPSIRLFPQAAMRRTKETPNPGTR